jgi:hypothetical protein
MEKVEWLDKHEAARALKMSTRSILLMASKGEIQSKRERDPESNQLVVKLHAGDIERVRYKRDHPPEKAAQPVKMQAVQTSRGNDQAAATHALAAIAERIAGSNGAVPQPLWLTLEQAEAFAGLPADYLETTIATGELPARDVGIRKGVHGRWRIRRADLEALKGLRANARG